MQTSLTWGFRAPTPHVCVPRHVVWLQPLTVSVWADASAQRVCLQRRACLWQCLCHTLTDSQITPWQCKQREITPWWVEGVCCAPALRGKLTMADQTPQRLKVTGGKPRKRLLTKQIFFFLRVFIVLGDHHCELKPLKKQGSLRIRCEIKIVVGLHPGTNFIPKTLLFRQKQLHSCHFWISEGINVLCRSIND